MSEIMFQYFVCDNNGVILTPPFKSVHVAQARAHDRAVNHIGEKFYVKAYNVEQGKMFDTKHGYQAVNTVKDIGSLAYQDGE